MGFCPTIFCPCEHRDMKLRLLDYAAWSKSEIVPSGTVAKFKSYAASILAFLCGGCHAMKSLQVDASTINYDGAVNYLVRYLKHPSDTTSIGCFLESIRQYCLGELTVNECFQEITDIYFTGLQHLTDRESWDIFKHILLLVSDPERQANLHLRYLRWRPRIWTPCCQREHCFRCRTKDFHLGTSCEDHVLALDNSILDCPSCGVYLVKGDGCNTMTCVCGKQFSWANEKETMDRSTSFFKNHPINTAQCCVAALVGENDSDINDARAWQSRHRYEVSQAFLNYWHCKYKFCQHQAAALKLHDPTVNEGVREAVSIWYSKFSSEVDDCRDKNARALRTIFLSLYPNAATRAKEAIVYLRRLPDNISVGTVDISTSSMHSAVSGKISIPESKLITSMRLWLKEHPQEQSIALHDLERAASRQFLYLYGTHRPTMSALFRSHTPSVGSWDIEISNASLTFSNNNTTVQRVGNVSSYPAAMANLPSNCDRSKFRVYIDSAPRGPNWLTVGLASKGMLPSASSDGLGRSLHTW